jgi:hypothetical protein
MVDPKTIDTRNREVNCLYSDEHKGRERQRKRQKLYF